MVRPIIVDCAADRLDLKEAALYGELQPFGFILFARHCLEPAQVRGLVAALHQAVGRAAPVLIDQEGGRVARLCPPHWRRPPPAAAFADLWLRDPEAAVRAAYLNSRLIAGDLAPLGVTVDCLPVLDLKFHGAHHIIGDRAYGERPEPVIALGRAAAEGLMAGGVLPVVKHIPGHGRAAADSHLELPHVAAPAEALRRLDFPPFAALADLPIAMTAHITYEAFDPTTPATWSRRVIGEVIRGEIGFAGVLLSDDVSMKALSGPLAERARRSLDAGCDIALLCNASFEERRAVLEGVADLPAGDFDRLNRLMQPPAADTVDVAAAGDELERLLSVPKERP